MLKRLLFEEKGEDMIEYALLVSLIAIFLIIILPKVATAIEDVFKDVVKALGGTP
jgi:Flp pilus assembly pilin Flp